VVKEDFRLHPPLTLDEIQVGLFSLLVALYHSKLLCHIQRNGVFPGRATTMGFFGVFQITRNALISIELILFDTVLYPIREIIPVFQKGMGFVSVDGLFWFGGSWDGLGRKRRSGMEGPPRKIMIRLLEPCSPTPEAAAGGNATPSRYGWQPEEKAPAVLAHFVRS
jgi:hypothetical protein